MQARRGKQDTAYTWLKEENFRHELKRQRDELIERALNSLKANIAKATETLVKHLDSKRENIRIRAAESIIEFAQKAIEFENWRSGSRRWKRGSFSKEQITDEQS